MQCPKCQYQQNNSNQECPRCGVIFGKYYQRRGSETAEKNRNEQEAVFESESTPENKIWNLFFSIPPIVNRFHFAGRTMVFIIMVIWGGRFIFASIDSNFAGHSFMHLVNLPFHEAGHILFRPFGAFIASLGGTLGQMMMPLICLCVLLLKTRDTFGTSVTLWWFAQNFFDLAPYINDARSGTLPLLGSNVGHSSPYGFHDWEFILTESGLLKYDHFLARFSVMVGTVLMFISFIWAGILLYKQYRNMTAPKKTTMPPIKG